MEAIAPAPPATKIRRALLNDTVAALPRLFGGRGVTPRIVDPATVLRRLDRPGTRQGLA
jgi:hypothetical protein